MNKQRKYSSIKTICCIYIEKIHRIVFDNQYKQEYKITFKDKPILMLYSLLFWFMPDFRSYLKHHKQVITRAYEQKRLKTRRMFVFWAIRNVNTERYSNWM